MTVSRTLRTAAAGLAGIVGLALPAHALPWFAGVGDLPGGAIESSAEAVSADAGTVVGVSVGSQGQQAFRWTPGGGMVGLGFLSGSNPDSEALGVSADGGVVVGTSKDADGDRGFRWTAGGGMVELGTFSCSGCDPSASAHAVSGDGAVAVGLGLAKGLFGDPHVDAARWPGGGTGIDDLGDLSGPADANAAYGASADGAWIVGGGSSGGTVEAWTWNGGLSALPGLPGMQPFSTALAISADADTVVGFANNAPGSSGRLEAVRWTGPGHGTVELLGALPGAASEASAALAVSGDGSVIVGRARNAANGDSAFVWTAADGMRDLAAVLAADYGLDVAGWSLREATGVSDVDGAGAFAIVGRGINPDGDPEGWVAFLDPPACSDGIDNDADLASDFPADSGCTAVFDLSETADCDDGLDNDGDGGVDHPDDADCTGSDDPTELPDCSDGLDNDGDGHVDHPDDPGCAAPDQPLEDPACDDGDDNDGDGDVDGADASCVRASDLSETPDCGDGLDNDGDGDADHPADPDCETPTDESEAPECRDGLDNDGDGHTDHPDAYPACEGPDDAVEAPQCQDGVDNDADGAVDHPLDPECASPGFAREAPGRLAPGDLLVVDRASRRVFAVDVATGAQSLLSEGALLSAPEGVAQASKGEVLVADPAGLIEVDRVTGEQRMASTPLASDGSLQVVVDPSDEVFVVESAAISHFPLDRAGVATPSPYLAVPTAEQPFPLLGVLTGGTLARAAGGDLYTTGASLYGDGVHHVDTALSVTLLQPGFDGDQWLDLAIEDASHLVAVAKTAFAGPGLYRVSRSTGAVSALRVGAPFVDPTAVAVDAAGDFYVADAGTCSGGTCTGGAIHHVAAGTGDATLVGSGGSIEGPMDLVVAVPEPGRGAVLAVGALLLARLAARRRGDR